MRQCNTVHVNVSNVIRSMTLLIMIYIISPLAQSEEVIQTQTDVTHPHDVTVGMFVTNLFDINFAKQEFKTEFWAWFLTEDPTYNPSKRTEIVNAKGFTIRNATTEKIGQQYWHSIVFKGTVKQNWDVRAFPFDKQTLTIHLEDTIDIRSDLRFKLDPSSNIAKDLIPDGWQLASFDLTTHPSTYPTTFGDPRVNADSEYTFDRITATLVIKREGLRVFATTFIGFFVATLFVALVMIVNMSNHFLPAIPLQPRVTLCAGALFASVGSLYGLESKLPYTTAFTLADSIQLTTFISIALAITGSLIADITSKHNLVKLRSILLKIVFAIFIVGHLLVNSIVVFTAVNS